MCNLKLLRFLIGHFPVFRWDVPRDKIGNGHTGRMYTFDIPTEKWLKQQADIWFHCSSSTICHPAPARLWLGAVVFHGLQLIEYPYLALEPSFLCWLEGQIEKQHPENKCKTRTHMHTHILYCAACNLILMKVNHTHRPHTRCPTVESSIFYTALLGSHDKSSGNCANSLQLWFFFPFGFGIKCCRFLMAPGPFSVNWFYFKMHQQRLTERKRRLGGGGGGGWEDAGCNEWLKMDSLKEKMQGEMEGSLVCERVKENTAATKGSARTVGVAH